jgi:hypothetical protein
LIAEGRLAIKEVGQAQLSDELVVLGMASDPKPRDPTFNVGADGTPVQPYSCGPELANLLEVYRGMPRIRFHEFEAAIRKLLHVGWQGAVVIPEVR